MKEDAKKIRSHLLNMQIMMEEEKTRNDASETALEGKDEEIKELARQIRIIIQKKNIYIFSRLLARDYAVEKEIQEVHTRYAR